MLTALFGIKCKKKKCWRSKIMPKKVLALSVRDYLHSAWLGLWTSDRVYRGQMDKAWPHLFVATTVIVSIWRTIECSIWWRNPRTAASLALLPPFFERTSRCAQAFFTWSRLTRSEVRKQNRIYQSECEQNLIWSNHRFARGYNLDKLPFQSKIEFGRQK